MLGAFLVLVWISGKWLFGASLIQAALPAFTFLWRWYILWSVLMGIYGLYTIITGTLKMVANGKDGAVSVLGNFLGGGIFSIVVVSLVWILHFGALLGGAHLLLGLVTGFSWLTLAGAVGLIVVGCSMQAIEWYVIAKS